MAEAGGTGVAEGVPDEGRGVSSGSGTRSVTNECSVELL